MLFFTNTTLQHDRIVPERRYTQTHIETEGIVEGKALDPKLNIPSTETVVREYFADTPVLMRIAYCESKFTHLNKNGDILRGELTPNDIGVMQINEYFHGKTAKTLGINLYTLNGNMAYAKWLYGREGTKPWTSSKKCWDNYKELARI